jgi:hypothetical protein
MKTSKKRTTTHKVGKSNGRSKKTNGSVSRLNKNEMKGMAGGFNWSAFGLSIASFLGQEAVKFGPEILRDGMKHFKK